MSDGSGRCSLTTVGDLTRWRSRSWPQRTGWNEGEKASLPAGTGTRELVVVGLTVTPREST